MATKSEQTICKNLLAETHNALAMVERDEFEAAVGLCDDINGRLQGAQLSEASHARVAGTLELTLGLGLMYQEVWPEASVRLDDAYKWMLNVPGTGLPKPVIMLPVAKFAQTFAAYSGNRHNDWQPVPVARAWLTWAQQILDDARIAFNTWNGGLFQDVWESWVAVMEAQLHHAWHNGDAQITTAQAALELSGTNAEGMEEVKALCVWLAEPVEQWRKLPRSLEPWEDEIKKMIRAILQQLK